MRCIELFFKWSHDMSGYICYQGIKLANEIRVTFYSYLEMAADQIH